MKRFRPATQSGPRESPVVDPAELIALGPAKRQQRETDVDEVVLPAEAAASSSSSAAAAADATDSAESDVPAGLLRAEPLPPETDVVEAVEVALLHHQQSSAAAVVLSALATLQLQQQAAAAATTTTTVFVGVALLGKEHPELFREEPLLETLLWLVRGRNHARAGGGGGGGGSNNGAVAQLAAGLLQQTLADAEAWPAELALAFVEDSLGDRAWTDAEALAPFVGELLASIAASSAPAATAMSTSEEAKQHKTPSSTRFLSPDVRKKLGARIAVLFGAYLNRRCASMPRSVAKLLVASVAFPQVRRLAATFLDTWLDNPSCVRVARDVLARSVTLAHEGTAEDFDALAVLVGSNAKTINSQVVVDALVPILASHPAYPAHALRTFVEREVLPGATSLKAPFNHKVLAAIWHAIEKPEELLALIMMEFVSRGTSSTHLCLAIKKIAKSFNNEISFAAFCSKLLHFELPLSDREELVQSTANLVCACMLAAVPPGVSDLSLIAAKETALANAVNYLFFLCSVQREALAWCDSALRADQNTQQIDAEKASGIVRRLLLLEAPLFATSSDFFHDNLEKKAAMGIIGEQSSAYIPVAEGTLSKLISLSACEQPVVPRHLCLTTLVNIASRAALLPLSAPPQLLVGRAVLEARSPQLAEGILQLALFCGPDGKPLPGFCSSDLLWRACILLLFLGSFNAETFGAHVWNNIPTARALMEMVLTRQWRFPALVPEGTTQTRLDAALDKLDQDDEATLSVVLPPEVLENHQIVPFYANQLSRRPPQSVLDTLRGLEQRYHLSSQLLRCKKPEFLTIMIAGQDVAHLVSWLGPVVHSDPSIVEVLPSSIVCELVLAATAASSAASSLQMKQHAERLESRLSAEIATSEWPHTTAKSILQVFLSRLASPRMHVRQQARDVLSRLVVAQPPTDPQSPKGQKPPHWLHGLPLLQDPEVAKPVCQSLLSALAQETCREEIVEYLDFLNRARVFPIAETATGLTNLLLKRPIVSDYLFRGDTECIPARAQAFSVLRRYSEEAEPLQREELMAALGELLLMCAANDMDTFPDCKRLVSTFFGKGSKMTKTQALRLVRCSVNAVAQAAARHLSAHDKLSILCSLPVSQQTASMLIGQLCSSGTSLSKTLQLQGIDLEKLRRHVSLHQSCGVIEAGPFLDLLS